MYTYIAQHPKVGKIGGIIHARDSVEAYTIASKEIAKRGGNIRGFMFSSI